MFKNSEQLHKKLQNVSRETLKKLEIYVSLLKQWNEKINLVSSSDMNQIWERHIVDSIQLVDHIDPKVKSIADFGSGGGFPGIVLALVTEIPVTLIESDIRKTVFLKEVLRETQSKATVICQRIEKVDMNPVDLITARALATLDRLLWFAQPKLKQDGYCLFLKGKKLYSEIQEAEKNWHILYETIHSLTSSDGVILKVNQFKHVEQNDE